MQHVSEMLDARGIPGSDAPITTMGDCPGFITGMQRGKHFAVYVITNVNKAAVTAIFNHSMPPSEEDAEGVTPPPRKHEITNAIIVHSMKCTTMAAREIEACKEVKFERFKIEELLRIPLVFAYSTSCEILDDEATKALVAETPLHQLPKIWTTDPIQRFYNAPVGAVYRIVEKFGVLQPEVKYRVVSAQSC